MLTKKHLKQWPTREELKAMGYKINVVQYRYGSEQWHLEPKWILKKRGEAVSPMGGETVVTLTDPDGKIYMGASLCPTYVQTNQKIGYRAALGRAILKVVDPARYARQQEWRTRREQQHEERVRKYLGEVNGVALLPHKVKE